MENIMSIIKKFPYLFVMLGGLLFLLGAIFNWQWICNPQGSKRFMMFIYEMFGEKGYRIFIGIDGVMIIICSLVLWIFSK